jgi:hypothetical protein
MSHLFLRDTAIVQMQKPSNFKIERNVRPV